MKRTLQLFSRYLPAIVLGLLLFAPVSAHASIFDMMGKIVDAVVETATNAVLETLGIDTETNCVEPRPHQTCLFCDMFKVLFNAGSKIAEASYNYFSEGLGKLIMTFLAVSLALMILKNVASMGSKDPAALLNDIMRKTFVCIAVYIIITKDYYNVLNMTIVPVLKDSLALVGHIGGGDHIGGGSLSFEVCSLAGEISGFVDSIGASITGHQGGIPKSIGNMIVCSVNQVEGKIYNMFEYGRWAFCRGNGPDRLFFVIPHPIYIIDGLLLYLGGIFFMVAYPWIMADAVLQLGISLAVLPFAVAGYAFKGTKNYLSKAFKWILHSMFVFIFMGILLECLLDYINLILTRSTETLADPKELFLNPNTGVAFYGPNMVMILFVLVIAWTYMPTIKGLAGNFSSGSSLSAAEKFGTTITNKMEEKAGQLAQYTADTGIEAAKTGARVSHRRFKAGVRQILVGTANTFGQDDGTGNKSFAVGGIKFTAEKNADGESVLKREYTSITGRKHVMISDKYSTIKQEYTASGQLIKDEVTFKHNFINKHLYNADGTINIGALQTLLNSPIGKNPAFRQSIISQLAIKSLKDQGKEIGTYFKSRQITFDPDHPEKIVIEQVDYSGKVTKFGMDINMQTGQTALSYARKISDPFVLSNMAQSFNKDASVSFINLAGHNQLGGGKAFDSWFGAHYEAQTDPMSGETTYTRTRKKYFLFGPKVTKVYDSKGLSVEKEKSLKAQRKHQKKIDKIEEKLVKGTPNLYGGLTKKTLFYTYESYADENGNMVYTKKLRKGWNAKNYLRLARNPFSKKNWSWSSGNVKSYSDSGTIKTDSRTGNIIDQDLLKTMTVTAPDGSQQVVDLISGNTISSTVPKGEYEVYFKNGAVELDIKGRLDEQGKIKSEKTKFKYSDAVQALHDSILEKFDGNQPVEADGTIADDLLEFINGDPSRPNSLYLLYGMDDLLGITSLNGMSIPDFMVQEVFAKGRQMQTNQFRTLFGTAFF